MKSLNGTRTFTIDLRGTPIEVDARIEKATAVILRTTGGDGQPVPVTCDDLDEIEAQLFETTEIEALDFNTDRNETFTVRHNGEHIVAIYNAGGYMLPESCPQFTETAEAFHIDRQWLLVEESDVQGYGRRCYAGF